MTTDDDQNEFVETYQEHERSKRFAIFVSGIIFIALGGACMALRDSGVETIGFVIGCGFLLVGICDLVAYIGGVNYYLERPTWLLTEGILLAVAGAIFMIDPFTSSDMLPYAVGMVTLFSGIARLATASQQHAAKLAHWWVVLVSALVSLLMGVMVLGVPDLFAWFIGAFSFVLGVLTIVEAYLFDA
jgi:uncharacterized membrane protein HdeD (DUF308 family)